VAFCMSTVPFVSDCIVSRGQLYTAILGLIMRSILPSTLRLTKNPLKKVESSTLDPRICTTRMLSISKLRLFSGRLLIQALETS
jgi:hypothetical protein